MVHKNMINIFCSSGLYQLCIDADQNTHASKKIKNASTFSDSVTFKHNKT